MFLYFLKKLGVILPTFFGVTLVAFVFIRLLPGDPVMLMAGERGMSEERHAALMTEMGFDKPVIVQYGYYLMDLARGDFGTSIITKRPVLEEFGALFPATVELSVCAMILAILFGLPAGMIAATKRGSTFDHTVMTSALTGYSMPIFWWGLLLIIFFSGILGWTPVSGRISLLYYFEPVTGFMLIDSLLSGQDGAFASALSHLILPAIVLGTIPLAVIARQTRSAMLEVLSEDYVRTARAKGLGPQRVIGLHALRNALIPVITVIGLQVGVLFAGAILTETIFSWPGIGKWMVDSIFRRDYSAVQGGLLLIAAIVMLVNLAVDLLYGLINPQIRHTDS
ncbi:ABC transporter permease subunit [Desulforhopalus sp. IMCC35007]|uniref:ABC transporter permease subunit n=1 Tax=Desulforhopalus sp. IMCC35007 TaxID=2569543 RepID=UPI0010AE31E4|nr:ABC transporter permease subunit [Desulforhopalus sp. IMCC35007]TKB11594.1 ABC transporter permease subunit [Desulforhopalus sp. IMCC35007]